MGRKERKGTNKGRIHLVTGTWECVVQVGAIEQRSVYFGHWRRLAGDGKRVSPRAVQGRTSTRWATRKGIAGRVHVLRRLGKGRLNKGQSRDGDGERIREWNRGRATGEVERGGGAHTIETLDSGSEFFTLHTFKKKLGNVFATPLILSRNGRLWLLFLVLVVHRAETVIGIHLLVLGLCVFCLYLPDAPLVQRQSAPAVP
jgi:hypothetical protein